MCPRCEVDDVRWGLFFRPTFAARLVALEFKRLTSKGREKIRTRPRPRVKEYLRETINAIPFPRIPFRTFPVCLPRVPYPRERPNVGRYVHLRTRPIISPLASFTFSSLRLNACRLARAVIYRERTYTGCPPAFILNDIYSEREFSEFFIRLLRNLGQNALFAQS